MQNKKLCWPTRLRMTVVLFLTYLEHVEDDFSPVDDQPVYRGGALALSATDQDDLPYKETVIRVEQTREKGSSIYM